MEGREGGTKSENPAHRSEGSTRPSGELLKTNSSRSDSSSKYPTDKPSIPSTQFDLSELWDKMTKVTVSGRSAIAAEYRYRVEPGRLVRKRVKHNPGDSPLTTQRHGSQDTAPASGAGDEIPLEIDFTLSIDDEAFWEATSPSLASKD